MIQRGSLASFRCISAHFSRDRGARPGCQKCLSNSMTGRSTSSPTRRATVDFPAPPRPRITRRCTVTASRGGDAMSCLFRNWNIELACQGSLRDVSFAYTVSSCGANSILARGRNLVFLALFASGVAIKKRAARAALGLVGCRFAQQAIRKQRPSGQQYPCNVVASLGIQNNERDALGGPCPQVFERSKPQKLVIENGPASVPMPMVGDDPHHRGNMPRHAPATKVSSLNRQRVRNAARIWRAACLLY
jgi:hypothetical protein